MKTILSRSTQILCVLALSVGVTTAQPLPKIELKPLFPGLTANARFG